jgi:glycosyltransferase involved in cell wall biosynthesis
MKRIKIAEVITRLDWAGSPDIVRIICESITPLYKVKLITGPSSHLTSKTNLFLEKFKDNVIIVPSLKRNINPLWDCLALIKLYLLFRKERFDIVHTHTAKAGILGRIAAYIAGIPSIIHTPHGHNFYGYFGPIMSKFIVIMEKFVGRFTNKIIVLTELEKRDFLSFKVKNPVDIEVVPLGLELGEFSKLERISKEDKKREVGLAYNDRIVGMVSRLEPVKGPHYFIEAAAKVVNLFKQVMFLVVGEGSLRLKLETKAQELGLKDRIKFLGWRQDALEIISILDILVQPSLNEGVGMVLLEAQSLGVPVIATNVGGIPEVVKDGVTGILVPSQDANSIAKALNYLLGDEKEREGMGREAKRWVKDKFSSHKMIKEIAEIYEGVFSANKQ